LVRIALDTGRKHQIRAHAEWLNHKIVGDKIYGSNPNLFLEFAQRGWTPMLEQSLPMRRQAIHAFKMSFNAPNFVASFIAPLAWDLYQFCERRMGLRAEDLKNFQYLPDLPPTVFESSDSQ
jgi:23S rRNA pseudouridine1911/1915/1917 synthase